MARPEAIRVKDRLFDGTTVWEVIETRPGGHVELFDRERARFSSRYVRELRRWDRLDMSTNAGQRGAMAEAKATRGIAAICTNPLKSKETFSHEQRSDQAHG